MIVNFQPLLFNASDSRSTTATQESLATPHKLPSIDPVPSHMTSKATHQIPQSPEEGGKGASALDRDALAHEAIIIPPIEVKITESAKVELDHERSEATTEVLQEMVEKIEELHVEENEGTGTVQGGEGDSDHRGSEVEGESAVAEGPGDALANVEVRLLEPEEGGAYLAQIIMDTFNRY